MKAIQEITIHPSNFFQSSETTVRDSIQTTNRKVTESDKITFCERLVSQESIKKFLHSNDSALNAATQNVAKQTQKLKRNLQEKENSNWLKLEMEKFQQIKNQATDYQNKNEKLQKNHIRRQSSFEEKTALSLNNSSEYSSINTFLQKQAEPKINIACNFCNTTLFKQSLKDSIKNGMQKSQIQLQTKLLEENSRLKAALEDMLENFQKSRAKEDNLILQVQQLEYDLESQNVYSNRLEKEHREMMGLLKMYEQLLKKMSEQNQKLKDWMMSRKLKDKNKRDQRRQRDTSMRTSQQHTVLNTPRLLKPEMLNTPRLSYPEMLNTPRLSHPEGLQEKVYIPLSGQFPDRFSHQKPPRTNRSPAPGGNLTRSSLTPLTYSEISVPRTLKLLETKSNQDVNKTQVKKNKPEQASTYRPKTVTAFYVDKPEQASTYRPKTVTAFYVDNHTENFENRAESTFGQAQQIDQTQDGYSYTVSRSPSQLDQNVQMLQHRISQGYENDWSQMREEMMNSITSLETSFRQLNVKPNYNYYI